MGDWKGKDGKTGNPAAFPLVSVIMPAFNAEWYLEEAIRSVMAQTYPHWELLVLDDASTDNTARIAARLARTDARIRLLQNAENVGVAATRNRGLSLCRGDYVAFLDSDDRWHPQKLERQLARLARTGAEIGYCSYAIVDAAGRKCRADYRVPAWTDYDHLLRENVLGCSTVLLSAKAAADASFDAACYHEDYVLWLRLLKAGYRAAGCPEVLAQWRFRKTARSFNKWHSAQQRWAVYRRGLGLSRRESVGLMAAYLRAGLKKYGKRLRTVRAGGGESWKR